jgi:hypothetical protein
VTTVIFAGHMVDAPGREPPRFPAERVPAARQAIRSAIVAVDDPEAAGISGAACGGDLLFCEEWLATGRRLGVHLPKDEEAFLDESVRFAGPQWEAAYQRVISSSKTERVDPPQATSGDPHLLNTARMLDAAGANPPVHGIVLWDGRSGDGPGGTGEMVVQVRAAGGSVQFIDPASLGGADDSRSRRGDDD